MRLQRASAHGPIADPQADDWPTCLCFFTRLTPAGSEMPGYAATAIDRATTPARVRAPACPPKQTSLTTLHASRRTDPSPGACTSPPRYTAPPLSDRHFHFTSPRRRLCLASCGGTARSDGLVLRLRNRALAIQPSWPRLRVWVCAGIRCGGRRVDLRGTLE